MDESNSAVATQARTFTELNDELNNMVARIIPDERGSVSGILERGFEVYGVDPNGHIVIDDVNRTCTSMLAEVDLIAAGINALRPEDSPDSVTMSQIKTDMGRLEDAIIYTYKTICCAVYVKNTSERDYNVAEGGDLTRINESVEDNDSLLTHQKFLLAILRKLSEKQRRRQGSECMVRVVNSQGYDTHAWVHSESIKEFIYKNMDRRIDPLIWDMATRGQGNVAWVSDTLEVMMDSMFTTVDKDRRLFSFRNGIYETAIKDEDGCIRDRWMPYESDEARNLNQDRISCKYFDVDFDNYDDVEDWYDIPTPNFQSILDHQEFSPEVCRWMYILLCGRMLYEVNDMDQWQIMPFLKGKAGTGKSTILTKVCKELYSALDVGVISNNVETQFGLSAVVDKFLLIMPEVSDTFKLDQCDFQSMVSGEDVSVATKNKTAKSATWKVPAAMAGNKSPGFNDNQGSIGRRLAVFMFKRKVTKGDTHLGEKLQKEIAAIMKKGNRAYIEMVNEAGDTDIWTLLPKYFMETRKAESKSNSPLVAYLDSENVFFDPDASCTKDELMESMRRFCQDNNFGSIRWSLDVFSNAFDDLGLEYYDKLPQNADPGLRREVVYGMGIVAPAADHQAALDPMDDYLN